MNKFPTKDKNYYFYKMHERWLDKDIKKLSEYYLCDLTQKDEFLVQVLGDSNAFDIRGAHILPIKFLPQLRADEHHIWAIGYVGSPSVQCNLFGKKDVVWRDIYWYYKAIRYLIDNYYERTNNRLLKNLINSFIRNYLYQMMKEKNLEITLGDTYYRDCNFIQSLTFEAKRDDYRLSNLSKDQFREKFEKYVNQLKTGNLYQNILTIYENKNYR